MIATSAYAVDPTAIAAAIGTGVKTFGEVEAIYSRINPPQTGFTTVINSTNSVITVRSYNNNDWALLVAAGQLNLKPGAQGNITASTDPIKLIWRRGDFGTLKPFGTNRLNQSVAPKNRGGRNYVFVIGDQNTF